jgi:hypothetical protein
MARRYGNKSINVTTIGAFTATAVLEGLFALAIAITLVLALRLITINRRDAARRCFYWLHATMAVFICGYLLSMTADAISTSLLKNSKRASEPPPNGVQLLFDARVLQPVGRLFRRIGAALCGVMLVKVAGGVGFVVGHHESPLWRRWAVYGTSVIAGGLALAEFVVTEIYLTGPGNSKNMKWALPRLDAQFNGSQVAMILGAAAVAVLALGALGVVLVYWDNRKAAKKFQRLSTVSLFSSLWGELLVPGSVWY